MSSHHPAPPSSMPGLGTFCVGFAFIISATLLNIAATQLPADQLESLPLVGGVFKVWGKLGVTIVLVTLGLCVLIIAAMRAVNCSRQRRANSDDKPLASPDPNAPLPPVPYYCSSEGTPQPPVANGRVVLETRKYLPASALSGPTGWDATTRRPPSQ